MSIKVNSLVSQAHIMAQLTSAETGEEPDGQSSAQAVLMLNNIMQQLNEDQLLPFSRMIVNYPVIQAKNSYSIGIDEDNPLNVADIAYDRPQFINAINIRLSSNSVPYRVNQISLVDLRARMSSTDSSGTPCFYAVDNAYPLCNIYFDVKPVAGYSLELIYNKEIPEVKIGDTLQMPSSYNDLFVTALASRLAFNANDSLRARIDLEYNRCVNRIKIANSRTQIPLHNFAMNSDYNRAWNAVNSGISPCR